MPSMIFVPIKPVANLDLTALHRVRQRLIKNRTALLNEMRAIMFEAGVAVNKGPSAVKSKVFEITASHNDGEISQECRVTLTDLYQELIELEDKVEVAEGRLKKISRTDERCRRLQTIPGVGIITATAVVASVPQPSHFKNGRQFAAWLGLVPRHTGTGGKNKILGISKRGDKYLRSLLVQGANSVIRSSDCKENRLNAWVKRMKVDKPTSKVSVALANKNARVILALLKKPEEIYRMSAA